MGDRFAEFLCDIRLRREPSEDLDAARVALAVAEQVDVRAGYDVGGH